jgi:hypothetical protein
LKKYYLIKLAKKTYNLWRYSDDLIKLDSLYDIWMNLFKFTETSWDIFVNKTRRTVNFDKLAPYIVITKLKEENEKVFKLLKNEQLIVLDSNDRAIFNGKLSNFLASVEVINSLY